MGTRFFKDDECIDYYEDDEISHALAVEESLKKQIEFIKNLNYKEDGHTKRVLELLQKILEGKNNGTTD